MVWNRRACRICSKTRSQVPFGLVRVLDVVNWLGAVCQTSNQRAATGCPSDQ